MQRCGARPGVASMRSSSTVRRRGRRGRRRFLVPARATDDADAKTSSTTTSALTAEELRGKLARVTRRIENARRGEGGGDAERARTSESSSMEDATTSATTTTSAREREDDDDDEGGGFARFGEKLGDWLSEVGKSFTAANATEDDEETKAGVDVDVDETLQASSSSESSESRDKGWFGEKLAREPESQGGWFRWTNGWRVSGESIASATSSWIPNRSADEGPSEESFAVTDADGVDAARRGSAAADADDDAKKKEGSQQNNNNFLERVPLPPWIRQRVFGGDESSSDDEEADEMGYAATMSEENVDSAIRDANENAASVTSAAVEKLNAALSRIETVEMTMIREGQNSTALESLRQSLREARASANAAREASQSLEDAVREVSRAQDALRSEKDAEGALKALDLAKRAVIRQASTSNNAVADALRQVSYVATRVERLGATTASDEGAASATTKEDGRRDRKGLRGALANARESAQDALVAAELTQTVSRLASFATRREDGKSKRENREELSAMVKPALQKVVANSLAPVSDEEIGSARLACSLAAWVYYLPQMQHALPRNGLRLITSSLDAEEIIPSVEFRAGKALMKDSAARAEQAVEEAIAAARVAAKKDARLESLAAKTAADAAQLAADALQLAAELRSAADDDEAMEKARAMALSAKSLAAEAQRKLDEANEIAKRNKRKLQKWKMQRELAELESEMQKTLVEQQKQIEANRIRLDRRENALLPVNFCVAAQDNTATLWVVIEGSTNFASWQANLTFQPVTFEDSALGVEVHRGAYTAAKTMYRRVEEAVKAHVAKHGARARVRITGHSIGGSIAMILAMLLLVRNGAPRYALADVWAFGAPYVMTGGEALLARLGLPRRFIRMVTMGDDIVPRSFSCYYPQWARSLLDNAPGPFNVDTSSANFLDEDMFYTPMGDMYMLQANSGDPHPLLPPGPGLYMLEGDGLYELLATRARDDDTNGDDESWLDRSSRAGVAGHWDEDASGESTTIKGDASLSVHQLACLTQSDAALTASLIVSHIKQQDLLESERGMGAVLNERSRDAAQRVLFNSPHPLTILSRADAYGDNGIISRHHNPFNYAKALSNSRKMKPGVAELVLSKRQSRKKATIDGAPASGSYDDASL